MKKLIYLSVFIISFISCQENESINEENKLLSVSEIQILAQKHNDAMEFVLSELRQSSSTFDQNREILEKNINSSLNSFYLKELSSKIDLESAKLYLEEQVTYISLVRSKGSLLKTKYSSPFDEVIGKYDDHLTHEQKSLFREIENNIHLAQNDFETSIINLTEIQNYAKETFSEKESFPVIVAVEIAKASLSYWKENIHKWQEAIGKENYKTSGWFDWSEVAGADVAGAIGGAVGAAVVNAVPGAGQVGYAGAILGGAAGGSATDAALQVWNHFF